MSPRADAFGMAVADMAATLAFYRLLGLEIPEGAESEGHVEATLPGGLRLMWDTRGRDEELRSGVGAAGGQRAHLDRVPV